MSICNVCKAPCDGDKSESVKCNGSCGGLFHIACVKDDLEGKKTRSSWKCRECRSSSTHGSAHSHSGTGNFLTKEFFVRIMEQFKQEVFTEIKTVKSEVSELSSAVQFMSDKLDQTNQLMETFKTELATLKNENKELRGKNDHLSNEVVLLKDRLRGLEQYSRRNNLEISGIPPTANESVSDIVRDVGTALGVDVQDTQIAAAHRVPTFNKGRSPSLIVQFHSRTIKHDMLSKFREKKTLMANQVNPLFTPQRVYVNEHLSPENKVFLSKLKQKCKEINYAYVWCRDGKFFARKNSGAKCVKINTYDDLLKLK